jgi:hypothetical protein
MTVLRKCTHIVLWNWPRRPHLVLSFSRPYPHVLASWPLFLVFTHPHIILILTSSRPRQRPHTLIFSYPCVSISSPPYHHVLTSAHSDPHIFTFPCPSQPGSRRAPFVKRCRIPCCKYTRNSMFPMQGKWWWITRCMQAPASPGIAPTFVIYLTTI